MNWFRPHLPGYMDFEREPQADFDTLDQLREIPQPKRFAAQPSFSRFSQSRHGDETLLMAEFKDGKFWVVGYMKHPIDDLPEWQAPSDLQKSNESR